MKQAVDNLIVSSSSVLAFVKGITFYIKYSEHRKMFALIEQLDKEIDMKCFTEVIVMKRVHKFATFLNRLFAISYIFAWIVLAIQSLFGSSEQVFWSSTALYPGAIGQNYVIYWIVFIFQAYANCVLVILVFVCDSYGVITMMILNGHFDILSKRLRNLGVERRVENKHKNNFNATGSFEFVDDSLKLKECIRTFYNCLR